MDYTKKNTELIMDNILSVNKDLVILNNFLSSQMYLTDKEFLIFSGLIRDLKAFSVEFEYLLRIKNYEDNETYLTDRIKKTVVDLGLSKKNKR